MKGQAECRYSKKQCQLVVYSKLECIRKPIHFKNMVIIWGFHIFTRFNFYKIPSYLLFTFWFSMLCATLYRFK